MLILRAVAALIGFLTRMISNKDPWLTAYHHNQAEVQKKFLLQYLQVARTLLRTGVTRRQVAHVKQIAWFVDYALASYRYHSEKAAIELERELLQVPALYEQLLGMRQKSQVIRHYRWVHGIARWY